MKLNTFKLESFGKEFEKELNKGERRQRMKAVKVFKDAVSNEIVGRGLVEDGDLLQGLSQADYTHATLVGMGAPAFHALIVELGSYVSGERFTKGKGRERTGIRSTGVMRARPFFLPAFRKALPEMQKILQEAWL